MVSQYDTTLSITKVLIDECPRRAQETTKIHLPQTMTSGYGRV